jgi:hypothetical protein
MTEEELSKYYMTLFLKTFSSYDKFVVENATKPLCLTEEEEGALLEWERLE